MDIGIKKEWLAACLITCLIVVLLWLLTPELSLPASVVVPETPKVVFSPGYPSGSADSELKAVWSPALVALPSRVVRRSRYDGDGPRLDPPLTPSDISPRYMDFSGSTAGHIDEVLSKTLVFPHGGGLSMFMPRITISGLFSGADFVQDVAGVALSEELKGRVDVSGFSLEQAAESRVHGRAVIRVVFDEYGRVHSAILDEATGDTAVDRDLIQQALKCFAPEPVAGLAGRITVFF